MQLLDDILSENYVPVEKKKIKYLFEKYGIYTILDTCTSYLKTELEKCIHDNVELPVHLLSATSSNIMIGVNSQVILIKNKKEKKEVKKYVADISMRILLLIIKQFPEEALEIFRTVKESITAVIAQRAYDHNDAEEFFNFEEVRQMIKSVSGQQAVDEIKTKSLEVSSIIWTERVDIGILSSILLQKKWIKSEREFWNLFDDDCKPRAVRINMKFKWHFAYLIRLLKGEDFIRMTIKKGHFKLIQSRLSGLKGESFGADEFKRLSSKVGLRPEKYKDIVDACEEIMKQLRKHLNGKKDD